MKYCILIALTNYKIMYKLPKQIIIIQNYFEKYIMPNAFAMFCDSFTRLDSLA